MKFNYCCCCLSSGLLGVNNSTNDSAIKRPQIVIGELCFIDRRPIDPANEKKIEENLIPREAERKPEEREGVREAIPGQEAEKKIQFVNKFGEVLSAPMESKNKLQNEMQIAVQNEMQNYRNWDIDPVSQSSPPSSPPPSPPPPRVKLNLFPLPEDGDDGRPKSPVPADNIVGVGFMSIRGPDQIPSSNSEIINQPQSLSAVEISQSPSQVDKSIQNESMNITRSSSPASSPIAPSGYSPAIRYLWV
jgi:hypothetical protein